MRCCTTNIFHDEFDGFLLFSFIYTCLPTIFNQFQIINAEQFFCFCQNKIVKIVKISAKKYLKLPAAVQEAQAEKTEQQERLWMAIKRHVLQERKRKKEGNCRKLSCRVDFLCKVNY